MKTEIEDLAFEMIKESGLINLSRKALCERAKIKEGTFNHIMGCSFIAFTEQLRKALPKDEEVSVHPVTKTRTNNPQLRKDQILAAAVKISGAKNYNTITRQNIADAAGVSTGLVARYFNTMLQIRRAIMRSAIKNKNLKIIAQGLVNKDPNALKAPKPLQQQAIKAIV